MTEADRDVLRTIIREELHAVLGELETARVRRSAALEELARNEAGIHEPPPLASLSWQQLLAHLYKQRLASNQIA